MFPSFAHDSFYERLTVCGPSRVIFTGYPLVDGTRQRHFDGTNFKPRKLSENGKSDRSGALSWCSSGTLC